MAEIEPGSERESESICDGFRAFLARCDSAEIDSFVKLVDDSDYSLQDWVEALLGFDQWLTNKGRDERPFAEMTGYVHCCTYTNSPLLPLPSLQVLVIQALEGFGFEAVEQSQN
ncbi:MAG: hypothetical protein AAGC68_00115 [Verrucomicrobiota bacterium]